MQWMRSYSGGSPSSRPLLVRELEIRASRPFSLMSVTMSRSSYSSVSSLLLKAALVTHETHFRYSLPVYLFMILSLIPPRNLDGNPCLGREIWAVRPTRAR